MIRRTFVLLAVAAIMMLPRPVLAQDLEQSVARVAAAWHKGDAAAISALGARAGISIDVDGTAVGPLGPRQASAVLRRVFEDRESAGVRATLIREVGGEPARAFGELVWQARGRGTTIPEESKLFVALVVENGRWLITEIRLLP